MIDTDTPDALVGRDGELTVLNEVLRRVRRGGQIVVIEGEAGIGKTRLLEAGLDHARAAGTTVLMARADELDLHRPLAPVLHLLHDAADPTAPEPLAGAINPEGGTGLDVEAERGFRVAEALLAALEQQCLRASVVVAIEDLHWADGATLGVIAALARGIEALPVALVVSTRPQPRQGELVRLLAVLWSLGASTLALGPLDEVACGQLVATLLGATPGPRLLDQARGAAGNPLFVTELVATMQAERVITHAGMVAEVAATQATPSLPITILHRLSFLAPDVLELLGLAAVLGTSFRPDDLALLSGRRVAQLVPALQVARRAGALGDQGDRLAFRHELIRAALYEDMPLSLRRALHAELARSLAAEGESAERTAEHLLRAAAPGDARSVSSLVEAGRELAGRSPSTAVELFRRAIELSRDAESTRLVVLPDLADALVSSGELTEGEAVCREAIARGLDPETEDRLRLKLVMLLTRRPRTGAALREAEAGLAAGRAGPQAQARLQGWVAMTHVFEGDFEGAVRDAEVVLQASDDAFARALAQDALALAASARGRFVEAAAVIERSAHEVEAIGTREAYDSCPHLILGLQLARLDRLDEAYDALQRGRRASEALGMLDMLASFHYELALVELLRGRLDDALAELATHHEYAEQTGAGWSVPADSVRTLIALHRGDVLGAERFVVAAERAAGAGAPEHRRDLMVLARARVLEASGKPRAALDALAAAFEATRAVSDQPLVGVELARVAALTGRPADARATVPALERLAELNPGVHSLQAAALQARGWVEGDQSTLLEAAELMRGTGRVLEAARAAEAAGTRELLEEARSAYERAGAVHDQARTESALRALGSRRGVRGRRQRPRSGWESLTETELRVVRLAAERLTNPEIAERLFISRRTVQTHISHALTKLGVASRRDLAAEAVRQAGWRIRVEGLGEQMEQAEPAHEGDRRTVVDAQDA
ncbi:MAG TPA: AAA family ATPase [Solirubrobacteraceae bacterium]|nr:AAA family ATPase [Solirubrobacteraceae bacterium]